MLGLVYSWFAFAPSVPAPYQFASNTRFPIDEFPTDVFQRIICYISKSDLIALATVNKKLDELASDILYKCIHIIIPPKFTKGQHNVQTIEDDKLVPDTLHDETNIRYYEDKDFNDHCIDYSINSYFKYRASPEFYPLAKTMSSRKFLKIIYKKIDIQRLITLLILNKSKSQKVQSFTIEQFRFSTSFEHFFKQKLVFGTGFHDQEIIRMLSDITLYMNLSSYQHMALPLHLMNDPISTVLGSHENLKSLMINEKPILLIEKKIRDGETKH